MILLMSTKTCTTAARHCEQCGSTDREDVGAGSYSSCCNELIVTSSDCDNFHGSITR